MPRGLGSFLFVLMGIKRTCLRDVWKSPLFHRVLIRACFQARDAKKEKEHISCTKHKKTLDQVTVREMIGKAGKRLFSLVACKAFKM